MCFLEVGNYIFLLLENSSSFISIWTVSIMFSFPERPAEVLCYLYLLIMEFSRQGKTKKLFSGVYKIILQHRQLMHPRLLLLLVPSLKLRRTLLLDHAGYLLDMKIQLKMCSFVHQGNFDFYLNNGSTCEFRMANSCNVLWDSTPADTYEICSSAINCFQKYLSSGTCCHFIWIQQI